jgi:hypothetical protein
MGATDSRPFDDWRPFDDAAVTFGGAYVGPIGGNAGEIDRVCYALGPAGFASLCRITWSFDAGRAVDESRLPFDAQGIEMAGILDTVDGLSYDVAAKTTHTLRYLAGPPLKAGDLVGIENATYHLVGVPQRINRSEMRAELIMNRG